MTVTLKQLNLFPLKSGAPISVDHADVLTRGLRHDRRWMVVDAEGKFITGRKHPRMTLIQSLLRENMLFVDAPEMPRLELVAADASRVTARVWDDFVNASGASSEADTWISTYLGQPARFVFMDTAAQRIIDQKYAQASDEVSFADGYPLLLISQAALDFLNSKLDVAVPMLRFRPNLVVGGTLPHAEDAWRRIRVGEVEFDVVKACVRCVFTTVDPDRGELDPSGEPLRSLLTYRRGPKGVTFGQNLIPRGSGTIRIGDLVEVLN